MCAYLDKVSGIKISQYCTSEAEDRGPDSRRTVTSSIFNTLRPRQNGHYFCSQYFQVHFLQWISSYFDSDFTEVSFQGPNYQHASIGSDNDLMLTRWQANGLALMRRQAIIWTNDGLLMHICITQPQWVKASWQYEGLKCGAFLQWHMRFGFILGLKWHQRIKLVFKVNISNA